MTTTFREASTDDVPAIVAMLLDDNLGQQREKQSLEPYLDAFNRLQAEPHNTLIVGERDGAIIAAYQLTFIQGLSHQATRRAQVESVRVAAHLRGQGIGHEMMADAEARARKAGCRLMQLTTHASRNRARAFYDSLGYQPTHVGYKNVLD
jgi:ribosomal protein S18 acetylase RimI-like enzyme